jgi:hypothetical protein
MRDAIKKGVPGASAMTSFMSENMGFCDAQLKISNGNLTRYAWHPWQASVSDKRTPGNPHERR